MSINLGQLTRNITGVHSLFVALLLLTSVSAALTRAEAQKITPPITPGAITPPAGNSAFCWVTQWGLKAMFACRRAQALLPLPGPSTPPAPKPPFL